MRSRILIGAGAWLLGAVTATTGSMIAVDHLADGLFSPSSQQLGSATATADLDHDGTGQLATAGASSGVGTGATASPSASASGHPARARHQSPSAPSPQASGAGSGTLLVSADGSVMAQCGSAGAYLQYWSPDQGFFADDVYRGPASVVTVTFRGGGSSVLMRISCKAGTPVAQISRAGGDDGGSGGDG